MITRFRGAEAGIVRSCIQNDWGGHAPLVMVLQVLNQMIPGNQRKRHLMMIVVLTRLALIDRFQQIVCGVMVDGIEAHIDQLLHARRWVAAASKRVGVRLRKEKCVCVSLPGPADQKNPGLSRYVVGEIAPEPIHSFRLPICKNLVDNIPGPRSWIIMTGTVYEVIPVVQLDGIIPVVGAGIRRGHVISSCLGWTSNTPILGRKLAIELHP